MIALEPASGDAQASGELVELVEAHVTDEMGPSSSVMGPDRGIDEDRHHPDASDRAGRIVCSVERTSMPGRRERLRIVLERDGASCVWCRRPIDTDRVRATTEHLVPRIKGGPSWIENELAACARCNRERGHRTPAEWIDECERRGWEPDREVVVAALRSLREAITRRGGQRRARPYIESQLRRLERGRPQP